MGEIIPFMSKSERERARLIREANALYNSIFPPADPASEQDKRRQVIKSAASIPMVAME